MSNSSSNGSVSCKSWKCSEQQLKSNHSNAGSIPGNASDTFEGVSSIVSEIKSGIQRLRELGWEESRISSLFKQKAISEFSRIVITKDYKILLADFDNYEICLTPLAKCLYLLYLKHHEGIEFKQLRDHYQELKLFYLAVSKRENLQKAKKSIMDLCNTSSSNSVNEKCSAIRKAFACLPEYLREYYYISGKKGSCRKILLPPDLIQWE